MTISKSISQRELVRLAVLMCGDRPGAKYHAPGKGSHSSANAEPWRGYDRL
jgi:hypothetical protein